MSWPVRWWKASRSAREAGLVVGVDWVDDVDWLDDVDLVDRPVVPEGGFSGIIGAAGL
jgi:hypothetical protein